jgi:hypothetical protein
MIESIQGFVGLLIFRSKELREAIISDIKITFVIITFLLEEMMFVILIQIFF